jgi:hypothetical protein
MGTSERRESKWRGEGGQMYFVFLCDNEESSLLKFSRNGRREGDEG